MLEVNDLTVRANGLPLVSDVNFTVSDNEWLMIVGPNGAGKSTIVRAISKATEYEGTILINGRDITRIKAGQMARHIGVLNQYHNVSYAFTVYELIRLGRYSYEGHFLSAQKDEDEEKAIMEAIRLTGMENLMDHSLLTLSGGELQRAFLAQLFAQDPEMLILDEPTNHLDLIYQKQIFEIIEEWVSKPGRSVVSVVHDLNLAKAYGSRTMLIDKGRVVSLGTTEEVLTSQRLSEVYNMDVYSWMHKMLSQWE
ncbi:MAG: ABC transporter ATP-binding protein [Eubacteriaceae bacterium]|nr:ABC transporter ATP-binding protein [Eubacteriaceae bacterium]MBR5995654.1 ABC transporter ATP-binding protein [Eubacteriaceae bacterium]